MTKINSTRLALAVTLLSGIGGCSAAPSESSAPELSPPAVVARNINYNPYPIPVGCRNLVNQSNVILGPSLTSTSTINVNLPTCLPDSTRAENFSDSIFDNHDEIVPYYMQFVDTCYANLGQTFYQHLKGRFPWAFVDEAMFLEEGDDLKYTPSLFEYLLEARRDVYDLWQADPQCSGVALEQYVKTNYPDAFGAAHMNVSEIASRRILSDFDGDALADFATYENGSTWNIRRSSSPGNPLSYSLGGNGLRVTPGDFDGDGRTDAGTFDPATGLWQWIGTATGRSFTAQFGSSGDIPVANDFDGDGKTDLAVWRPSNGTWYVLLSSSGSTTSEEWGTLNDVPVTGDYDGDGTADYAVWRPSENRWWIIWSSDGTRSTFVLGNAAQGDLAAPGDFDNDGITDVAVFSATGDWTIRDSSTGTVRTVDWGDGGDVRAPNDYDGDGQTDVGVWRSNRAQWFHIRSSNGVKTGPPWGSSTGIPVSSAYMY
jgi:VCBS repeat protein